MARPVMCFVYVIRHIITCIRISLHGIAEDLLVRRIYQNLKFCCYCLFHIQHLLSSLNILQHMFLRNIMLYK